jgi:hypothetical protein
MVTSHDQQPVQALGADRTNPALRKGVRRRRLHRCQDDPGALGAEQLIEAAAELGVPVAQEEAQASSPLAQCQQEVAGLLGDSGAIRIGGHASQVDAAAVQLDEEQHIRPPQPDGEEGAGDDPGGLLAQERPPGRIRPPWHRVQPMPTQHRPDRGSRDRDAEVLQFALDPLVAPARVLPGQRMISCCTSWSSGGRPVWRCGLVQAPATSRRCQRSRVSGLTKQHDQRERGNTRLMAASNARSAGPSLGRAVWRRSTPSW